MNSLNLHALTAALAKELDGTDESQSDNVMTRLTIMDGAVALVFRAGYGATWNKVTISAFLPFENVLDYYNRTKIDSITVTGTREPAAIAKDIRKRLLDGIAEKVEAGRAKVAEWDGRKEALISLVVDWEKRFPGLQIRLHDNGQTASLYYNKNGVYLTGDVRPTGEISIQRFSISGPEQALALLALISRNGD